MMADLDDRFLIYALSLPDTWLLVKIHMDFVFNFGSQHDYMRKFEYTRQVIEGVLVPVSNAQGR